MRLPLATNGLLLCSAYVLALGDVIRMMFSHPDFARFAGVRTRAMVDSPHYFQLDSAHNNAISALASDVPNAEAVGPPVEVPLTPRTGRADEGGDSGETARPEEDHVEAGDEPDPSAEAVGPPSEALNRPRSGTTDEGGDSDVGSADEAPLEAVEDPDPSDEVVTGEGDTLALLFGLFVDGVQLKQGNRETTTVVSLKCLDLPGFLVGTTIASYNLAFISGPKEPTCMTDILGLIVHQFKELEPNRTPDSEGTPIHEPCPIHKLDQRR